MKYTTYIFVFCLLSCIGQISAMTRENLHIFKKKSHRLTTLRLVAFKNIISNFKAERKDYILERLPLDLKKLFLWLLASKTGRFQYVRQIFNHNSVLNQNRSVYSKLKELVSVNPKLGPVTLNDILVSAVFFGDLDVVKNLIEADTILDLNELGRIYNGDKDCLFSNQKLNALMAACYTGNTIFFQELIKLGADVNKTDLQGLSPLMYCLFGYLNFSDEIPEEQRTALKQLLTDKNILNKIPTFKINLPYKFTKNLLMQFISELVAKGANPNLSCKIYKSRLAFMEIMPYFLVSLCCDASFLEFFLENYLKFQVKDKALIISLMGGVSTKIQNAEIIQQIVKIIDLLNKCEET